VVPVPRHLPLQRRGSLHGALTEPTSAAPGTVERRGSRLALVADRDRMLNLGLLAAAFVVWVLVALVVTTRDPVAEPTAGILGAALIGLAVALTLMPILWLVSFARQRRISYAGDWTTAIRRGAWVGGIVSVLIVLRLQDALELPIALFIIVLVVVAEATLSADR
jgi:hypothetical protein